MNPSETIDTYGQYEIREILGPPSYCEGPKGFRYGLVAVHREGEQRYRELRVEVGIQAALEHPRLKGKTGGALNAHIKNLSIACLHGLLDLGLFEESDEYTWIFREKEEVFEPSALDIPDSDWEISYHLLKALHRVRQEQPQTYTSRRLDPAGICLVLHINEEKLEYVAGRLQERGEINAHGDLYNGEFHITELGIQTLRAIEQAREPKTGTVGFGPQN